MDPVAIESLILVLTFLFPICFLVVMYVIGVMLVAMAMTYVKAGRPAWLSLVPLYSFIELLDIAGISVWWGLVVPALTAVSVAILFVFPHTMLGFWIALALKSILCLGTLGFMSYLYYHLSRSFGESGWYAAGYLFLPFIFFPLLGFGSAKFKGSKKKSADKQRNKLIIVGIIVVSTCLAVGTVFSVMLANLYKYPDSEDMYPPDATETCYGVSNGYIQHLPSASLLDASVGSFNELTDYTVTDNCYGEDSKTVFFRNMPILNADVATFKILRPDAFYAIDAKRVYAGATVVPDADPKNFTDLTHGYAKGKKTVFYVDTGPGGNDWNLKTVEGVDIDSFEVLPHWNAQYDAYDKNRRYSEGAPVATSTRE